MTITPAYPHFHDHEKKQDGRGSWKSLIQVYEGQHFKILTAQVASSKLRGLK